MFTKLSLKGANTFRLFFLLALIFSPVAAAFSFLVTYSEFSHHFSTKKQPLTLGIEAAVYTFVAFMVFTLGAGWIINGFSF